ncbi:MAG: 3-isopropylmalate dehydratase large subunit [Armatimonadota bacterium]
MGMTITEKILAAHAGQDHVSPGDLVTCKVDFLHGNDITAPIAIRQFRKMGAPTVFDKMRVGLVPDHSLPAKDIASATLAKEMKEFAKEHNLPYHFDIGRMGIEHTLLPDEGLVLPGDVAIGADSHTCTYGALGAFSMGVGSTDLAGAMALGEIWLRVPDQVKVIFNGKRQKYMGGKDMILATIGKIGVDGGLNKTLEFTGEAIRTLPMCHRFTMANMAIEGGADNGIIAPDEITREYVEGRAQREFKFYSSDEDAFYCDEIVFDLNVMEPIVAYPFLPENTHTISEAVKDNIKVDQVVVGSCTNGRIEDLRDLVDIIRGRQVHPDVRLIVFPGSQDIYKQAIREGLVEEIINCGGAFSTPTCGPCLGGHSGVLAPHERCLSTTNRNFRGRMGHTTSEVYLANPSVAGATAILGRIAHPDEVIG